MKKYTTIEIDNIATDIAVMRGSQERRNAIKKLIRELQDNPKEDTSSNWVQTDEEKWNDMKNGTSFGMK